MCDSERENILQRERENNRIKKGRERERKRVFGNKKEKDEINIGKQREIERERACASEREKEELR